MADNDNGAPEKAIETVVEQVLKVPAAIIDPTLGRIVDVLEKIVGELPVPE